MLRVDLESLRFAVSSAWSALHRALARIDPNDDAEAERLGAVPVVTLVVAIAIGVDLAWRWRFPPMEDFGRHVALAGIVADRGHAGSLTAPLYGRLVLLTPGSLLYALGGTLGRLVGVSRAVRVLMVLGVAGVPLANAWALRVFGRSPWGALVTVPLVFGVPFVNGAIPLLVAAPLLILALPVLYRTLQRPTRGRVAGAALLFVALFLADAQAFAWGFVMSLALALTMAIAPLVGDAPRTLRVGAASRRALAATIAFAPVVLLTARAYARHRAAQIAAGAPLFASTWRERWGAPALGFPQRFAPLTTTALKIYPADEQDLEGVVRLVVVVGLAVALARLAVRRRPPVMELAFAATVASYFFIPDGLLGYEVSSLYQIAIAFWFVPALVTPVPWHVSRAAHAAVVAGIVYVTRFDLHAFRDHELAFEHDEVTGLAWVLEAAPPRGTLAYVDLASSSAHFVGRPLAHADGVYAGDHGGLVEEMPAALATPSLRPRTGPVLPRVDRSPHWAQSDALWAHYDLVLTRGWHSVGRDLESARAHAVLVRAAGEFQLWRRKGEWQGGADDVR